MATLVDFIAVLTLETVTLFPLNKQTVEQLRPQIRPRSDWAQGLPVKGKLVPETDVQFLLLHHSASSNDYTKSQTSEQIRSFYQLHTGPEKGWADVAYNFFVDRFGVIWEARQGSIDAAVRGDATGGSQGFALLCCLIGNYQTTDVTDPQKASLVQLLAWLGQRHDIDTTPGATISFTSRGSNRWPTGAKVKAQTISGHRDMSLTSCPGDFLYNRIAKELPTEVSKLRQTAASQITEPGQTQPEPTKPNQTQPEPTDANPPTVNSPLLDATEQKDNKPHGSAAAPAISDPSTGIAKTALLIGGSIAGVTTVGAVAGLIKVRNRRQPKLPPSKKQTTTTDE